MPEWLETANMDLAEMCRQASGKPLQPMLKRMGFPREQHYEGPLWNQILEGLADKAQPNNVSPTGFSVGPPVLLTEPQFRILEKELGRSLCNSGDVLFGSIQIATYCPDEGCCVAGSDEVVIDCRALEALP